MKVTIISMSVLTPLDKLSVWAPCVVLSSTQSVCVSFIVFAGVTFFCWFLSGIIQGVCIAVDVSSNSLIDQINCLVSAWCAVSAHTCQMSYGYVWSSIDLSRREYGWSLIVLFGLTAPFFVLIFVSLVGLAVPCGSLVSEHLPLSEL